MSSLGFPVATIPLLLRDSPVLAWGSLAGRQNRQIRIQCTSVTAVAHTSATVTATVSDGYLPIAEGDSVTFGNIQNDDDLTQGTFSISAVVSQNMVTGVVVFTVLVDTITSGAIAGVAFIQPLPAAAAVQNADAYAVQEGCKGISWDTQGLSSTPVELQGALNVNGPWGAIGTAVDTDQTNIATLPAGVRFVRLQPTGSTPTMVANICAF